MQSASTVLNGWPQGPNQWKYGILCAAEDVVRAGVFESVHVARRANHVSPVSQITDCSSVWVWVFWVWFFLFGSSLLPPVFMNNPCWSYQPMTYLAYIHDCHCCHNERSIDQKKKKF